MNARRMLRPAALLIALGFAASAFAQTATTGSSSTGTTAGATGSSSTGMTGGTTGNSSTGRAAGTTGSSSTGMTAGTTGSSSTGMRTATTGSPPTGMNNPSAPDNNMKATSPGNTFSSWMSDYSQKHNGRISRKAYMDEAGRRWDSMDRNHQGLTSDQINQIYGSSGDSTMSSMAGSSTTSGGPTGSSTGAGGGMNKGK